jgi:hypothetical protein
MLIARLTFTASTGNRDRTLELLKNWQRDVGERSGVRTAATRITYGYIGHGVGLVEFEMRIDSLGDLENVWKDLDSNPHHAEYMGQIAKLATGDFRWCVHKVVDYE